MVAYTRNMGRFGFAGAGGGWMGAGVAIEADKFYASISILFYCWIADSTLANGLYRNGIGLFFSCSIYIVVESSRETCHHAAHSG